MFPLPQSVSQNPVDVGSVDTQSLPTLSVLLPIMNEISTLCQLIDTILAVPIDKEIIIVDDGSTDGTTQLLHDKIEGKIPTVSVYYHKTNQGKGMALRTAIPHAIGKYSIIQDGDLEYDPNDYLAIVAAFNTDNVSVVYGSRFMNGFPKMKLPNRIVNILLSWMVRFLYRVPLTDEATCYKAFKTSLLQSIPLKCKRFEFCPEITAKVLKKGFGIIEVPIRYSARTVAEGKKIRWTDGVEAIWTLCKYRVLD